MALIGKNDTFVEYQYNIEEFIILIKSEKMTIPTERVLDFKIEHYFEQASFPIFKVNLMIEPSRYYKIIKNKDNVKIKVRIQKWNKKNGSEKKSLKTDEINDTFSIFLDDDNSDYQEELKKLAKTDKDEDQLEKLSNKIELFLFKTDFVTGLRSSISEVLTNVNLTTTVVHLLEKAGIKHMLMSPFDNSRTYGELVLPPQSIEKQLKYLNNNFGFYKKGAVIYFGLNNSYILDYKAGCTAHKKKEWQETVIYVLEESNSQSALSGAVIKQGEKKFYYCVKGDGVNTSNTSVTSNAISGTDGSMVTMTGGGSISSISSGAKTIGKTVKRVIFNNTSNSYMASTYAAQQYANSTVLTLAVENFNLEAFHPNKKFSVIFESAKLNKKYKGTYRISEANYFFTNNGDNYTPSGYIVLKRVK